MARRSTAARRYAEAAFQMGKEERVLESWERDLATLRTLRHTRTARARLVVVDSASDDGTQEWLALLAQR